MGDTSYADQYRNVNFRNHPEKYVIGRGEQGVLMAEPYKSELLPHWRFRTPEIAEVSASKIYDMFNTYKADSDFVGMDMARKFLQMGFTRSRRYANHASGTKYDVSGAKERLLPQDSGSEQSVKAASARVFKGYYDLARLDPDYLSMKQAFKLKQATN